jgi:flavin-dependent dehydrogenase
VLNGALRAPVIVGAGGHFCPVARRLAGDGAGDPIVAAQEIEFALDADAEKHCGVQPELPELFFSADLRGYGWVVRKGRFVNVGLGRQDTEAFPGHVEAFLRSLAAHGRLPRGMPRRLHGHAYRVYDQPRRALVADAALWIGDAAGLADPHSGEGIRPAVESGLLAARTLLGADGRYGRDRLAPYERAVRERFAGTAGGAAAALSALLPVRARRSLARRLLARDWFARRVVIDGWFLHRDLPALSV